MHRSLRPRGVLAAVLLGLAACSAPGDGARSDTPSLPDHPAVAVTAADGPGPAITTTTAARGTATQVTPPPPPGPFGPSACDLDLVARLSEGRPRVRQYVVVLVDSFSSVSGTVQVVDITRRGAVCRRGPMDAMLGRNGTRPLLDRRSGDGTTPAGVFPLGVVASPQGPLSFFGTRPDPGVRGDYRQVQPGDCYGATPGTPGYGHWRVVASPDRCVDPDEYLPSFVNSYAHAAIIGANTEPDVSGDAPGEVPYASAIFLHHHSYAADGATPRPVSGCVTLAIDDLRATLRLIDPGRNTRFAIGPREFLLQT